MHLCGLTLNTKRAFFAMLGLAACVLPVQAQWLTQSFTLKPGWNAVYLNVDASYDSLQDLVAADTNNPISDVWIWNPSPAAYQLAASDNSQWASWSRTNSDASLLQSLVGNAAYLVNVYSNYPGGSYTWKLKGRPVPASYLWTSAGINLVGFPTVTNSPPFFNAFLLLGSNLYSRLQTTPTTAGGIYRYVGGPMQTNPPANPAIIPSALWRSVPVTRGQAYWFCITNCDNTYFGPFSIDVAGTSGIDFDNTASVRSFRLRNQTSSNITVTLSLGASEAPPAGQTGIVGVPPLLVRGALNASNLTYACTNLAPDRTYACKLAPQGQSGSEASIVLGLNRSAMTGQAGSLWAGVLSLTDSLGFTKIDVPVSATVGTSGGLWVGNATVNQVGEYLKTYATGANGAPATSTNAADYGAYILTNTITRLGSVPTTYPLRLIVHNPTNGGPAVLLQHVFYGLDAASNAIVSTTETALSRDYLKQARRISAAHLPWTAGNTPWAFNGSLERTSITVRVTTAYDDQAANPFIHTYHPDHDNLDTDFKTTLPPGVESYTIQRDITLTAAVPAGDFDSYVSKGQTLSGTYAEKITLMGLTRADGSQDQRTFQVSGYFSLTRLTDVSALTTP